MGKKLIPELKIIKVERGVKIPPRRRGSGRPQGAGKCQKLAKKMKKGDCILVENYYSGRAIRHAITSNYGPGSCVERKCKDGWRLWRIK